MERDLIPYFALQDPLSCVSHVLGCLSMLAGFLIIRRHRSSEPRRDLALRVWLLSGGFQLFCSAVYHAQANETVARTVFWHLDHATIWLALAGCFTAVMCSLAPWQPRYLAAVWAVAVCGVVLELSSLSQLNPWISPVLYIFMGWLGFPLWLQTLRIHGLWSPAGLIGVGGAFATAGGAIDASQVPNLWPRVFEAHELMHVCIALAGWCYLGAVIPAFRAERWTHPAEPSAECQPRAISSA